MFSKLHSYVMNFNRWGKFISLLNFLHSRIQYFIQIVHIYRVHIFWRLFKNILFEILFISSTVALVLCFHLRHSKSAVFSWYNYIKTIELSSRQQFVWVIYMSVRPYYTLFWLKNCMSIFLKLIKWVF